MAVEHSEPVRPDLTGIDLATVSQACAEGRHHRCRGKVYRYPVAKGEDRWIKCKCPIEGCGHGPHGI